jgi:hypothetical protein
MNVNYCYKTGVEISNPMNNTGISGVSKNSSDLMHQNRGLSLLSNSYNIHGILWISV